MPKQLDTLAAVEAAKADFVATGEPVALQRYEDALREWLFPPRVGSMQWNMQRNRPAVGTALNAQVVPPREPPRDDEGSAPLPCSPPPIPLAPSGAAAHPQTLIAAE